MVRLFGQIGENRVAAVPQHRDVPVGINLVSQDVLDRAAVQVDVREVEMPGKDFACRLGMIQMKFRKSISVAAVAALGLAANAAGKKLIAHGWDTALLTPGEILANAERFDGSPFDGLGVTLPGNDRVMTDAGWTKERFAADCETLRAAVRHPSLRESLLMINLAPQVHLAWTGPGATSFRVNGEEASLIETVPADEFQVLAFPAVEGVRVSGFTQSCFRNDSTTRYHFGGNAVAEAVYYAEALSKDDLLRAEAYLNRKWFGRSTPGCRPARAKALHVGTSAEVVVVGGAPLAVEALAGSGRIDGAVTVADAGTLEVVVSADGTPLFPEVSGTLILDGDGTLLLCGNVRRTRPGSYCLAPAATVAGAWRPVLAEGLTSRKAFSVTCRDGGLWLDVRSPGALILVR